MTTDLTPLVAGWPDPPAAAIGARTVEDVVGRGGDTTRVSRIASVSKLFVTVACLVAVEEGTIELDEPAGRPGATVRHLLAHAAGYDFDRPEFVADIGARRVYSNVDIEVLAEHLSRRAGMPFAQYQREAVLMPLRLEATELRGSPAFDIHSNVDDLLTFAGELLAPTLVAPSTLAEAATEQFAGLAGVLPGWGRFDPLPWGLGFEIKGAKSPHWSGSRTSQQTFGHFGGSGTYLFVDPVAGLAAAGISGTDFDKWAVAAWPSTNDALFDQVASETAAEGR
jgi:CubicO group peptidase (beta-lactamase class C family)